ncbi:hypothetical protein [Acinetobacter rudis]|uniref:hypothetical protein n=1 Tax=Acinetobacter rudis TaxID=632955 RepID=UPI0033429127
MQLKLKLILGALLLTIGSLAYANICEEHNFTDSILKQANLSLEQGYIGDCKVLPQQQDRALLIFQLGDPDAIKSGDAGQTYQLHLLTADTRQLKLLDHYIDPTSYTSDAVELNDIRIDTAVYQLQPQLRAIGLRLSFANSSSVNPYAYTMLNLYDLKQHKKVLSHLRVNLGQGENDGRCNADNHSRNSTVVILDTQHHGMFDLRINTKELDERYRWIKTDCEQVNSTENKRSHILKFNGKDYVIPRYLQEYAP